VNMRLYPLIVTAICLQKVSSADLRHPFAASTQFHIAPALAALHVGLIFTAAVLETIVPTVTAMMPDQAPLIIGAWTGCNALALRVSNGRNRSHLKQQVSS
jgi:hypothetical protein